MNCKMAAGTRLLETVLQLKPKEKFTFNSEIKEKKRETHCRFLHLSCNYFLMTTKKDTNLSIFSSQYILI